MFRSTESKEAFFENPEKQDAVIRRLEIIGEAVKNLPFQIRDQYPEVPWKRISGMRDVLIHQYFGITLNLIWGVVQHEVPELKRNIQMIKKGIRP